MLLCFLLLTLSSLSHLHHQSRGRLACTVREEFTSPTPSTEQCTNLHTELLKLSGQFCILFCVCSLASAIIFQKIFIQLIYLFGCASSQLKHVGSFSSSLWHANMCKQPRIEPRPPVLRARSLSHWTTREVPVIFFFIIITITLQGFLSSSDSTESAMQETWVQSLGWEDPLEEGLATHSRILAWRIPWTDEPGRLQSMESQRVRHD